MSAACHSSTEPTMLDQVRVNNAGLTRIHIALAGQPNVGKSTVFNLLTGLNQHVGNWPGKTVEQKIGTHQHGTFTLDIVDLPGTYSLTANSPEELIARDYLLMQYPDVIVAIVDAAILERSLYLVAELVQLGLPLVVGLNMIDVATQNGIRVDTDRLSQTLGVPVVDVIAAKNIGIEQLVEAAIETAVQHPLPIDVPRLSPKLDQLQAEVEQTIAPKLPAVYPLPWAALKLMEGDKALIDRLRAILDPIEMGTLKLLLKSQPDAPILIAGARYEWIAHAVKAAVVRTPTKAMTVTAQIDRVATHPIGGLGVLAAVLAALFALTYTVGQPIQNWLDVMVIHGLTSLLNGWLAGAPELVRGLIVDGVIGGAGTVLTFAPILVIFFAGMAVLEDIGYMARAAYLMDGFMRVMGLHGKSFLPLFLGFGCNVPSIAGTRVIEASKARLLTIILMPLIPCTARMAVVAFMTPAFFGAAAPLVALGLVLMNLGTLAVVGAILSRTLLKSDHNAFIMELPLYHRPNARTIGLLVWQRTIGFVKHAGTLILLMALIVWALSVIPTGRVETSLLGMIGHALAPIGNLMGLSWQLLVALLASFVAKENSIATLGILFSTGDNPAGLAATLSTLITPAAALSFLVVQLLFIPCAATVGAIKHETRSWKWTLFAIGLLAIVSFSAGIAVYQIVSRLS